MDGDLGRKFLTMQVQIENSMATIQCLKNENMNLKIENVHLKTENLQVKSENVQILQYCHQLEECLKKTENFLSQKMMRESVTKSKSFLRHADSRSMGTSDSYQSYQPSRLLNTRDSIAQRGYNNPDDSFTSAICELSVAENSSSSSPVQVHGNKRKPISRLPDQTRKHFSPKSILSSTKVQQNRSDTESEQNEDILEKSIVISRSMNKKSVWLKPKNNSRQVQNSQSSPVQSLSTFALCKVESLKKTKLIRYYVVEITAESDDSKMGKIYKVNFFKRKDSGKYSFLLNLRDQGMCIYASDIVLRLPTPEIGRRNSYYKFPEIDFTKYNMAMY